ncbi:bifunctional MaoC family dehydratase N-terminal/OB-fold nucleic acid binding domain-containing protein [Dietzia sp. ANT_WB102]|uniref:bifunctional MaoC family dehydratase N-terminal/OB-fold nucleic acid binding domain-containing protein n=1 Tax=Dietzia sp. ANT_WB102 TaxID=2597345 RepID=UPI0011ED4C30|nr:bifunctional MaoC family dehydratase N-terminal/OB-fold nucleic acid binding domain-containing protein [Dietzia sp. ANT_WB102]KAA0917881.1 DNA-binding protein [Dietzia sp. ANT_WB102]
MSDEQAARILAAAEEVRASGGSARRAGRDPINLPMIRNWTEAIGDTNPIYESEDAARASGHGGLVAPPAMAQVWTMRGLGKTREADDPLGRMTDLLDAEGFTSVVATNCDSTYHRYTRPGEEVTIESVLVDVVGPKTTGLGEGWFFTTRNYWRVGDEIVAEMDFRILKFRPAAKPTEPAAGDGAVDRIVASSGSAADDLVVGKVLRPSVSHDTRFFWDGVRAHELRIQKREDGSLQHPPVPALWKDKTEETDYVVASGRGTVFSFVTHHAPRVPGRTRFPFVIALVELSEGVRMLGELRDIEPDDVRIGMEVEVEFLDMPGDTSEDAAFGTEPWTLYAWRPAGAPPVARQMPEVTEGGAK